MTIKHALPNSSLIYRPYYYVFIRKKDTRESLRFYFLSYLEKPEERVCRRIDVSRSDAFVEIEIHTEIYVSDDKGQIDNPRVGNWK